MGMVNRRPNRNTTLVDDGFLDLDTVVGEMEIDVDVRAGLWCAWCDIIAWLV